MKLKIAIILATMFMMEGEKQFSPVEKVVAWYMENMNYGTVTLLMAVESSFIPFPSEVVIPPAAYKASQPESGLNIFLVVVFGTLGALLGAVINYFLALWLGRPVIYRFANSRFGHFCLIDQEKVEKAENYFYKHGNISTLIGRLVPVIRQLISLPAGMARMPFGNFVLYTTIGALVWNIILAIIGYAAHGSQEVIEKYSHELSYIILALAALFIIYLFYNAFRKKTSR
jgi:membrane protein DedA with SNARE-associated domain